MEGKDTVEQNSRRFAPLFATMATTDIPSARPNLARQDEATGLTLLSLALTLDHVTRVTEALKLINTDHLSRSVSIDIDLRQLNRQQQETLAVHERTDHSIAVAHSATNPPFLNGSAGHPHRIWVPVSRHSREDLAPVVVKDAAGTVVPRLTQAAATNAVVAGVARLFRMHLGDARLPGDPIAQRLPDESPEEQRQMDHRARWLIEAAIARLIEHGLHKEHPPISARVETDWSERQRARELILGLSDQAAKNLGDLLTAASREYFLIVMLNAEQSHHFLTYEAPLIPAVRSAAARRRAWRSALPVSTEFTVNYVTQLPRTVGSYHVTIDVPEEIDVRRFILSSDADRAAVEDLARRIDALLELSRTAPSSQISAIEQQEIESSIALLGQRRQLDVEGFEYYLRNRQLAQARERPLRRPADGRVDLGMADLGKLRGLRAERAQDRRGSRIQLDRRTLGELGVRLRRLHFGLDVSTDNDPRENGAHAQWRSVALGFGQTSREPVEASVYLALADEPPALVESVARMLGALIVVVLGILAAARLEVPVGQVSQGQPAPLIGQADAAVAVLLIVPGILLARLDIPATQSVLGRLRRFPRAVAYLSVAFTTGLAMVVATSPNEVIATDAFLACAGLLIVLLVLCQVEKFARSLRRRVLVPASAALPSWLRQEFVGPVDDASRLRRQRSRRDRTHPPDVYFDAIRPVPNTTRIASKAYEETLARRDRSSPQGGTVDTEGPALVADLGARAVASGHTAVWCEVSHDVGDRPVLPHNLTSELLYVSSGGVAMQVATGFLRGYAHARDLRPQTDRVPSGRQPPGRTVARWERTLPLAPASIRSRTADVDLLVDFGPLPSAELSDRLMGFLVAALGKARWPEVVPTLVLSPSTTPARTSAQSDSTSTGRQEARLQRASGATLRLTFTIPHNNHTARLELESAVAELADLHQVALWRASRSPGVGQGDWALVSSTQPDSPTAPAREVLGPLIPLTFVAESGEVSMNAFRELANALWEAKVHVASLTASVVGQFATVQLIAVGDSAHTRSKHPSSPPGAFRTVAEALAFLESRGAAHSDQLIRTTDPNRFDVCIAGTTERAARAREDRRALWVDWELPTSSLLVRDFTGRDLADVIVAECQRNLGATQILYWRMNRSTQDRMRGRTKLAVDVTEQRPGEAARDYARRIGEHAKAAQSEIVTQICARVKGLPSYAVFLHVVWSEPWLNPRRGF